MMGDRELKDMRNGGAIPASNPVRQQGGRDVIEISRPELLDILKNLEGVKRKLQNKLGIQA
jgi:hypothetical protein